MPRRRICGSSPPRRGRPSIADWTTCRTSPPTPPTGSRTPCENWMPDFLWGVSSAGHQTEGDNTLSDTWFLENVQPTVFREPSGPACDGYARWRSDVDLAAGMGLNAYRFSVEWARAEP